MYLKSIEVQGFKSFANKIVFEFHDGITGIVGPNGSGKSNVADAVRWVLGEQSAKQLRGAKMEDIIFSGTETRKPLGFAYVAITLDNLDHKLPIEYEQVTVARRVYRSGESEYLLNGNSCRLKDVQELFLDTGIGKEGYSIIGQGQIDKILSGKPEDRRELFDEAAGIVKFKKRKAVAEKNLESEKQNLYRINDILSEIEKQISPLEKQSGVAKEYLKLKEELKVLDVNVFLAEYDRIHNDCDKVKKDSSIVTEELLMTQKEYSGTKEEYDNLEIQIEQFNKEIEDGHNSLSEDRLCKEKLEGDIKVLNEQRNTIIQSKDHYKDREAVIHTELEGKNKELEHYVIQKQEIDDKLAFLTHSYTETEKEQNMVSDSISALTREIEHYNSEIIEYLTENSNIKTKLQRYETMLEQNNLKKVELNQRILKHKSNEAVFLDEVRQYKEEMKRIEEQLLLFNKLNEEIECEIELIQKKTEEYKRNSSALQQEYHTEKSRLVSLKNMTERYEGYGSSIRMVMEQKDKNHGIIGVVADIIKVEKMYETAMEVALGGSIQNIVTDTENTAKNLIDFLKKNKYGRATFLPLTSISSRTVFKNPEVLKEKGVIGLASALVTAEKRYDSLVEYLLSRTVIVDHIENAIEISRKYHYSLRIVTLDGEQLSPGGSMSGGAYRNSSNLLGRRREIEDLNKKVECTANSLRELEELIVQEKQKKSKQRELFEENKRSVQEYYLLQNTQKMNLNQSEEKIEEALHGLDEIHSESREIDYQIKDLKQNISVLNESLQVNKDKSKENEGRIEEKNKELEGKRLLELKFNEKVSDLKTESSAFEQKGQFAIENRKRIKREISKLEEELEEILSYSEQTIKQIQEKESNIEKTKEELVSYDGSILLWEKKLKEIQEKKEKLSINHKAFFAKRELISDKMNLLDKETFRLTNQIEKLTEQLDSQITYMWEEYELTYGSSLSLKNETELSIPQKKKMIAELKSSIKNLGDVNVNAIEDYKNLMERFELLSTQRDDLVRAEEVLKGIIEELDNEMRRQFEEKFRAIKNQFDLVFKELFGGGKGTLELIEEEDILEAGIRIIAQPPGKKLQNMMQLSGGEKALTAISLLFAIQNLKPSPFCLLDEIEAALDDSNVKRYAKYLHKLTKDTQFIIITHRRGTMAAADVLYGITMQEKGVSTLVSVNLIEDDLEK